MQPRSVSHFTPHIKCLITPSESYFSNDKRKNVGKDIISLGGYVFIFADKNIDVDRRLNIAQIHVVFIDRKNTLKVRGFVGWNKLEEAHLRVVDLIHPNNSY